MGETRVGILGILHWLRRHPSTTLVFVGLWLMIPTTIVITRLCIEIIIRRNNGFGSSSSDRILAFIGSNMETRWLALIPNLTATIGAVLVISGICTAIVNRKKHADSR